MRDQFSGYYRPTDSDFALLWAEGVFVFDTNVLLNLYSYPEEVRNVFISVLLKIKDRIWIPYQVGLEFHRNRFSRIKQSNQRVEKLLQTIETTGNQLNSEVRSIELEKRNIGISDIQDRLAAVQEAHKTLSEAVKLACDRLPPVSLDDAIGEEICRLLENKVGKPPADQHALDALVVDGQERFDKKIPPGFGDEKNKGDDTFRDRGIIYLRKFGDLILWRQLMDHAKANNLTKVVLVTGDKKPDWWWLDDHKTLGPLPELVQEIKINSQVELFWMYSADQFLKFAETYLKATEVTAEAVEQAAQQVTLNSPHKSSSFMLGSPPVGIDFPVADIGFLDWINQAPKTVAWPESLSENIRPSRARELFGYIEGNSAEGAIEKWLIRKYPGGNILRNKGFPNFIVDDSGLLRGYQTRFVRNFSPRAFPPSVVNSLLRGYLEVNEGRLSFFNFVLAIPIEDVEYFNDSGWQQEVFRRANNLLDRYPAGSIIIGFVNDEYFEEMMTIEH